MGSAKLTWRRAANGSWAGLGDSGRSRPPRCASGELRRLMGFETCCSRRNLLPPNSACHHSRDGCHRKSSHNDVRMTGQRLLPTFSEGRARSVKLISLGHVSSRRYGWRDCCLCREELARPREIDRETVRAEKPDHAPEMTNANGGWKATNICETAAWRWRPREKDEPETSS